MFCLTQLACIAGGILLCRVCRKMWVMSGASEYRDVERWPRAAQLLVDYGWLMILIPIACVLVIPRHAEDQEPKSMSPITLLLVVAGILCTTLPLFGGVMAMIRTFKGW